jgi:ABC-type uncharacterized transport system substrate-binding protein
MIEVSSSAFARAKAVATGTLLCLVLFVACPIDQSRAQTKPIMAWVDNTNANPERLAIFKKGLADLGYGEGLTIKIEYRAAERDDEYPLIMSELIAMKVDIIVASNAPAAVAAHNATRTIPIVMGAVNDPVGLGLVDSLERPGTNVTGTTMYAPHLIGERGASPAELPVAQTKSVTVSVGRKALDRSGLKLPKDVSDRVNDWLD